MKVLVLNALGRGFDFEVVDIAGGARTFMNIPAASQKRLVIVGATGMVGGYAFSYALDHLAVEGGRAIGRRKLGLSHPKLTTVLHRDLADCSALVEALSGQDAALRPSRVYGLRRTLSSAR